MYTEEPQDKFKIGQEIRIPRIGDRVLIDPEWTNQAIHEPKFCIKGRILGATLESYHVSMSPLGIRKDVPHGAVKLDL